jgi:hypothetical protein
VAQYARYRAPAESGQKLVAPPWAELPDLARANEAWRASADLGIAGQSLAEFGLAARRELLDRAHKYVAGYHPAAATMHSPGALERPLIFTGHQPEMVHPGVWVKNFAAGALARSLGGAAVNLIIDADDCRSTAIRIPAGTVDEPHFAAVEFDGPAQKQPWEERGVVAPSVWQSFADLVKSETSSLLAERLLDQWWPTAQERYAATGRIGASLAQARHLLEHQWGQQSLELPQSDMCRTDAFRSFACHLMGQLPRFVDAYNGALADYRRAHKIRNHAHPVSNLERRGPWLQAPFWAWSAAEPVRRAVFVRRDESRLLLSDLESFERALSIDDSGDYADAIAELGRWEAEGFKLRSRALITTMFVRLAIADLFIHGIGGAKYDEATDAICERFFGVAPPPCAAISGTLRLPIAHATGASGEGARLRQLLRNLEFHPEKFVGSDGRATNAVAALISEKHRWVNLEKTPTNAAQRHEAIVNANRLLQPYVAGQRSQLEAELARAAVRSRASRVLDSREYAFCLFPRDLLRHFMLDFSPPAL